MEYSSAVTALMRDYPKIFFSCHRRHTRDPQDGSLVSEKQVHLLDHLDEVTALSLTSLAKHMGVTLPTMSITVDRLVRRGYMTRTPDPADGRRVLLRLTPTGARVTEAHSVLDPELVDSLIGSLAADDQDRALAGLELLANAAAQMPRGRWNASRSA